MISTLPDIGILLPFCNSTLLLYFIYRICHRNRRHRMSPPEVAVTE